MAPMGARIAATCIAAALTAATVGACGSDDSEGAGTSTTITIAPTSYVTRQPVTTTTTGQTKPPKAGDTSVGEQLYTVRAGDGPALIAALYEVDLEELANYNQWPEGVNHPIYVGDVVKIPPGAKVPEDPDGGVTTDPPTEISDPPGDTDPPDDNGGNEGTTRPTRETRPDNCEPGTYTVQEGDTTRIAVAEKFDLSVGVLDAANRNTDGYESFYVGLDIVIPPSSDC